MKYEYSHEKLIQYHAHAEGFYSENSFRFSREYLLKKCTCMELCEEHRKELVDFIDYLQTDEDLKKYIWTFYYTLFETEEAFYKDLYSDHGLSCIPMPKEIQDRFWGYAYSVLMLLAEDHLQKTLDQTNDKEAAKNILQFYRFKFREYAEINHLNNETYGLQSLWPHLYSYANATTMRLGRLIYQVTSFKSFCEVYECDGDRKIVALPTDNYDDCGFCKESGQCKPVYNVNDHILTANVFEKNGLLRSVPVQLDLKKYKKVLSPADNILTIHIPRQGKLLDEDVNQSLLMAKEAIKDFFKKYEIKGIVSYTWLLDTQLCEVMKESSNILQFQKHFDIVLHDDDTVHTLCNHIFNVKEDSDFGKLVPQNSFQRAMLERINNGKRIYLGYGILK